MVKEKGKTLFAWGVEPDKDYHQTSNEQDNLMALNALNATFSIAKAQIDAAKKTSKVSGYFSGYYSYLKRDKSQNHQTNPPPNGVLRAHVVKAECCLLIAVLQLLQESVMGYIKCGLNLRRGKVTIYLPRAIEKII